MTNASREQGSPSPGLSSTPNPRDAQDSDSSPGGGDLEPETNGWKPYTMRPPILGAFILVSLVLAAATELLAQKSRRDGGLLLSTNQDSSPIVVVCSQYIPTIIAVAFSLSWTWIDLDIRRMQPWFQLSLPSGGSAETTLLLDYPFEFLAFIPVLAFKKRHWLVFFSGTVMMIIFWGTTPLQSAIFGVQSVGQTERVPMVDTARLGNLDHQLDYMDAGILNDAYAITWLRLPFPRFTSSEHAYIPLAPARAREKVLPDETWTTAATALSTTLDCWPAIVTRSAESNRVYEFDNGRGCKTSVGFFSTGPGPEQNETAYVLYTLLYIGYYMEDHQDWYLESPDCGLAASHQFLATWARLPRGESSDSIENTTGLFCEPRYEKQVVSVAISARDGTPAEGSVVPLGEPQALGEDEFNSTAFEYLVATGFAPKNFPRGYPRRHAPELYPMMSKEGIAWPATNMVGYAIGDMNYTLADLENLTALHDVFSRAHKKLFSIVVSTVLDHTELPTTSRPGEVKYTLYGIVVSRPISVVLEAILYCISLLVGTILFLSCKTPGSLVKNPTTLGSQLVLFRESGSLLKAYSSKDPDDTTALARGVRGHRYYLGRRAGPEGESKQYIGLVTPEESREDLPLETRDDPFRHSHPHVALRPLSGFVFIGVLVAGIAVLLYLKKQEQALGVLQLLENYIPTVFATLAEPFLVLLCHLRCLLQPFRDLRSGRKPASKVFGTALYSYIPPQFTSWGALRSGHFLLATLSAVSLLSNISAVALGAIFGERTVAVRYDTSLRQTQLPELVRSSLISGFQAVMPSDHFNVAKGNVTAGTRFMPWTDPDFAFLPFVEVEGTGPEGGGRSDNSTWTYRGRTWGFGAEIECSPLSDSPDSFPHVNYTINDGGEQTLMVAIKASNGSVVWCGNGVDQSMISGGGGYMDTSAGPPVPGMLAQEQITFINTPLNPLDGGQCVGQMVMSWWRADPAARNSTMSATHILCTPAWRSALFDVAVDPSGYVLESAMVGEMDDDGGDTNQSRGQDLLVDGFRIIAKGVSKVDNAILTKGYDPSWHNDTLARDWMNYLLGVMLNTTRLVDPREPVPDPGTIIPGAQKLLKGFISSLIGNHLDVFKSVGDGDSDGTMSRDGAGGSRSVVETRIFMEPTALATAATVLVASIAAAMALYVQERTPFLPRLPSTIGSLLAYVAASRAVRGYHHPHHQDRPGAPKLEGFGTEGGRPGKRTPPTYGFGRYIGVDGMGHRGIEMDPFVARTAGWRRSGRTSLKFGPWEWVYVRPTREPKK